MQRFTKKDLQMRLGPDLLDPAALDRVLDAVERMPVSDEERMEILESWREFVGPDPRDQAAADRTAAEPAAELLAADVSKAEPAATVAPPIALSIRERISKIFGRG